MALEHSADDGREPADIKAVEPTATRRQSGVTGALMNQLVKAINEADEQAAAERVSKLQKRRPGWTTDEVVDRLIADKSRQTGAVGAVTSGTALVPGLGTIAALTFGVAADIGLTFKMQAELVLEIAAAYGRSLTDNEKRNVVMLVTGLSAGSAQVLQKAGTRIAEKASERLAQRAAARAIPVLGVAASAGTNMLATYVIGRRAQAYFSLGPDALEDWGDSVRAVTGVDERRLVAWLGETTESSWGLLQKNVGNAAGAVLTAGRSAGEIIVSRAGEAGEAVSAATERLSPASAVAPIERRGLRTALQALAGLPRAVWRGVTWPSRALRRKRRRKKEAPDLSAGAEGTHLFEERAAND